MKFRINLLIESEKVSTEKYMNLFSYEAYLVPSVGDRVKINNDEFLVLQRILPTNDNKITLIGELIKL